MGKQSDGRDASFEPFPTVDVARARVVAAPLYMGTRTVFIRLSRPHTGSFDAM